MRIISLLVPVIFFPVFAHADTPPTLTTYTVSYDTIYPSATSGSGLATTTSIDTAFSEQVKVSIKITSSTGATVKSLYSSSGVTNPTPKIWDGTNTAGTLVSNGTYTILISATSTATSLSMIDSSKTVVIASSDSTPPETSSDPTTITTTTAGGASPEYIPIPILRILADGNRTVSSGADTAFTATVYDSKGNKRNDATVMWSFGDGMKRTGASVFHAYYSPGEYVAIARATTVDGGSARVESIITVKDAGIKITSISARGIALTNSDSRTLDLSFWRLLAGGKEFKIPEDTQILAGRTILFPTQVIQLSITDTASLLYPSGEVVAMYPAVAQPSQTTTFQSASVGQPSSSVVSYKQVQTQTVEPIISTKKKIQAYEDAVETPTAATELAAVGATLPQASSSARISDLFRSPWTLGLLGMMVLAGAAFIRL